MMQDVEGHLFKPMLLHMLRMSSIGTLCHINTLCTQYT